MPASLWGGLGQWFGRLIIAATLEPWVGGNDGRKGHQYDQWGMCEGRESDTLGSKARAAHRSGRPISGVRKWTSSTRDAGVADCS